jgi:putative transposase
LPAAPTPCGVRSSDLTHSAISILILHNLEITNNISNVGLRHRNGIKGGCFFVTTSVVGFIPVFKYSDCALIILDSLKHYSLEYGFKIPIFVIMPSHLHIIVSLPENVELSNIMRDIKKYTSVQIKRLFSESSKYNNLFYLLSRFVPNKPERSFKLWQDRFDDVSLYTEEQYKIKYNYIMYNPVRAGLCEKPEDYRWSSFYRPPNASEVASDAT